MAYLGHKPAVGENNSFRILDDISSFVLTFDGSSASVVGLSDETITITENNHRFITGQRVTYSNGGGGNITGLTNGQAYFVINHSKTQIKLASSASNALAGTAINLTGLGTGSSHTLTLAFDGINTKFDPTFGNGMHDTLIKRAAQLVISINGVIQQPHDTATPSTGFGVDSLGHIIFSTAPASTDIFWGHILATNTVTFDSSDNDVDTFTGNGSTTSFTLSKTPPDNRNILVTIDGVVQYPSDAANTRSYNVSENVMTFVAAPGNGTVIQVRHIGYAGVSAGGGGGVTGFYGRTGNVSLVSTDNIVANNATFNGNVSIAQTLTYEDVTDIDSVGLITARSGIKDQTLTAGHVVFAGTGGRLSGEANLFYDSTNDKLGVGAVPTNYPGRFVVSGDALICDRDIHSRVANSVANSDRGFKQDIDGTEKLHLYANNDSDLMLEGSSGVEKLRIKAAGSVGIGTTNPGRELDVYKGTGNDCTIVARVKSAGAWFEANSETSTGYYGLKLRHGNTEKWFLGSYGSNNLQLKTATANASSLLEVTADGKIGIGSTTIPSDSIDISKVANHGITIKRPVGGSNPGQISLKCMSYGVAEFRSNRHMNLHFDDDNSNNQFFRIYSDDTQVFTIKSDGKTGIGTVTPGATLDLRSSDTEILLRLHTLATKNAYLDIVSDANRRGIIRFQDTDGTYRWSMGKGDSDELTNTSFFINAGNNGGTSADFVIDSNGDVGINQTNPTQKLHVGGSIKLTAQFMQSMPADFWSQGNTFIELNGVGNLTHMGGFETNLTSNGYRDDQGQWVSYSANSQSGAAQIGLTPTGEIRFRTDASKANGTAHNPTLRAVINNDGFFGINESSPYTGLSIGKLGDYMNGDGNTYWQPVGKWSSLWVDVDDVVNNTDFWVGFGGGYHQSSSSVNISLAPNRGNVNAQQGMYISGEATGNSSSDVAVGKIIGGSTTGRGTSGNVRATKSELFRITNAGNVGVGSDAPGAPLDIHRFTNTTGSSGTTLLRLTNHVGSSAANGDIHSPLGQLSFIDFRFLDANAAFTPQVRIGAQVGEMIGDNGIASEGKGSFVVYTGKGTDGSGGGSLTEKMKVTPDGAVVIRHDGATASDGHAGLEVRAAKNKFHLVLSSSSADASDNQVKLGFKLHPSGQDERIKAAIVVQGTGGGYGQADFMSFCLDTVSDNGNTGQIYNDERVRIDSTGFMGPIPRTGAWQGTYVYRQQSQGQNYEHKIRGPMSGYIEDEMATNSVAYIKVQTLGTGTNDAYCEYIWSQDGESAGASLTHIRGNTGNSSNRPYMVLDGQHPTWKTAHSVAYNFLVRVEITGGDDGETYTSTGSYAAN